MSAELLYFGMTAVFGLLVGAVIIGAFVVWRTFR